MLQASGASFYPQHIQLVQVDSQGQCVAVPHPGQVQFTYTPSPVHPQDPTPMAYTQTVYTSEPNGFCVTPGYSNIVYSPTYNPTSVVTPTGHYGSYPPSSSPQLCQTYRPSTPPSLPIGQGGYQGQQVTSPPQQFHTQYYPGGTFTATPQPQVMQVQIRPQGGAVPAHINVNNPVMNNPVMNNMSSNPVLNSNPVLSNPMNNSVLNLTNIAANNAAMVNSTVLNSAMNNQGQGGMTQGSIQQGGVPQGSIQGTMPGTLPQQQAQHPPHGAALIHPHPQQLSSQQPQQISTQIPAQIAPQQGNIGGSIPGSLPGAGGTGAGGPQFPVIRPLPSSSLPSTPLGLGPVQQPTTPTGPPSHHPMMSVKSLSMNNVRHNGASTPDREMAPNVGPPPQAMFGVFGGQPPQVNLQFSSQQFVRQPQPGMLETIFYFYSEFAGC